MHDDYEVIGHEVFHIMCNEYLALKEIMKITKERIELIEKKFGIKLEE